MFSLHCQSQLIIDRGFLMLLYDILLNNNKIGKEE